MIRTVDVENNGLNIHQATKQGYIFCPEGGIFDMSYPKSKLRRGRVQGNGHICPTITCAPDNLWIIDSIDKEEKDSDTNMSKKLVTNVRLRKLTERECGRLMDIDDEDIDKLLNSGISMSQLYKMFGNSICVGVLENIFRTMLIEKNGEKGQTNKLF